MRLNFETTGPAQPTGVLSDNLLLAEFFHRSANDFAQACAEVHVAGRQATLSGARGRLETVIDRLHSLASIQRLLQPPSGAAIDLTAQLCDLCHYHAQARFAEQSAFVYLRANDIVIDAGRGWALLMIVSELLTNAARHAFCKPGGIVHVDAVVRHGELICLVRDNGIGLRSGAVAKGAGTDIVAELARNAGFALKVHRCPVGTTVELRTPVASEA